MKQVRDRVIEKLADFNLAQPIYSIPAYDMELRGVYQVLWSKMPWPHISTATLTIAAGTDTFTFATNLGSDFVPRLQRNGLLLHKLSNEELTAMREGQNPANQYASIPIYFTVWNEPSGAGTDWHGRVWPPSRDGETADVFHSRIPPDLLSATLESSTVLFDDAAAEALVLKAASTLYRRLPQKRRDELEINPEIVPVWEKDCMDLIYRAAVTHYDLQDVGRVQRWVS